MMLPLAGISQLTDKLLADLDVIRKDMDLPDDDLGAEMVLVEALVAYQDAQERCALAAQRYRDTQRNWAILRMKRLKEQKGAAEAAQKAVAEMNSKSSQEQTVGGQGPGEV